MNIEVCRINKKSICLISILILAALLCWVDSTRAAAYAEGIYFNDKNIHYVPDNSEITAQNMSGIRADNAGTVIAAGDEIVVDATGHHSSGLHALHFGTVVIGSSADIKASGFNSRGAYARDSSEIEIGNYAKIAASGDLAHGVHAFGNSNITVGDYATITTSGKEAFGSYAFSNSSINIGDSAAIATARYRAHGAYALGKSNTKIGDYATISTSGDKAHGAYAFGNSDITIGDYATIATSGGKAYGAYTFGSSDIKIGDYAQITTSEGHAHGAFALSNSNIAIGDYAKITTSGKDAIGVEAFLSSGIAIGSGATIRTSNDDSHAIYARANSEIEIGEGADISTAGAAAYGVYASERSSLQLNGGRISATGENSLALYSKLNSRIIGSGKFSIIGDMRAGSGSGMENALIDMTLENDSQFIGRTSYASNDASTALNLTLNGTDTRWLVTGDSELTNLYMNNSTVDLTQMFGITLTAVNLGQYHSDRGIIKMDTQIADEEADKLIVTGTVRGKYILDITNSGADVATGREITDLALLEQGQGEVFTLNHVVECGGWQFVLDSRALPSGQDMWHLRSGGSSSTTGSGAVNSFAGSYLMAYAETNTLMQRMGDLRDSKYSSGLWFRVHGGKFESDAKSYVRGFDMKYGGVQIGYDRKLEKKWGGDLYLGAMFGYSNGDLDYSGEGSGKVDSMALGLYGVYIRPNGFYIDTVLKYQWMTNNFDIIDTAGTRVRGNDISTGGIGASIEVGKRFRLAKGKEKGNGWYVEPQLQLSYQRQDGGYFNATNGLRIGVDPFTSLLGRVGMLVGYETEKTNLYGKISKVKEFNGDLTIHANGVPITDSFEDNWWVYGVGCAFKINDRNSLYMDIERTSGGSFNQPMRINAGWRIEF